MEREKRKVVRSESAAEAPAGTAAKTRQAATASRLSFMRSGVTTLDIGPGRSIIELLSNELDALLEYFE
jgi:hypothetical protein